MSRRLSVADHHCSLVSMTGLRSGRIICLHSVEYGLAVYSSQVRSIEEGVFSRVRPRACPLESFARLATWMIDGIVGFGEVTLVETAVLGTAGDNHPIQDCDSTGPSSRGEQYKQVSAAVIDGGWPSRIPAALRRTPYRQSESGLGRRRGRRHGHHVRSGPGWIIRQPLRGFS